MFPPDVQQLLGDQSDVVARRQLLPLGVTEGDLRRHLRRRELTVVHPGVYVAHTGPLLWVQRAWSGVLAVWPAVLTGESALRAAEGPGRKCDDAGALEIAVDRHRHVSAPSGVRLHRIVDLQEHAQWNASPPRLRYDEAALEVALAASDELAAIEALARAVRSRHTTAARLAERLDQRSRVTSRPWLVGVLADIGAGTCSVLEHGYLTKVERPHGLPPAQRQVAGVSSTGLVYRDGVTLGLYLELDGRLAHDSPGDRDRDFERDLDAAVDGHDTRRLSWGQVYRRPCSTAAKVGLLLQQRGWAGAPRRCGPTCAVGDPSAVAG